MTALVVMIGWLLAIALAFWVAVLAEDRGQPSLPWFVVGLFLPIVGLLILLVAFPRPSAPSTTAAPTADDGVVASAVARALTEAPHASVHHLIERTGLPEREVLAQLRALRTLGRVVRDDSGRFDLTSA